MTSSAWKGVERLVAVILGGVRSWETDHDVLVPTWAKVGFLPAVDEGPEVLMYQHKVGQIQLASVEVKNLKAPTVAQLERYLAHNQTKIDRDIPGAINALVVKRKAGRGQFTPYLLVMPLEVPSES
jgi:hypothetical protein